MAILENVVFAYCKMQKPVNALNEKNTEFTVDAIISKAAAKAWNKEHPGNKVKSYDNEEFLEKFNLEEVPFDGQDDQYVVKLKKMNSKNGVELPEAFRPRVFELTSSGKKVDVTFSKLVGNGSKGKVSYGTFSNSYGEFVQLEAILVEEMNEYVSAGTPGSEFGDVELAECPKNQKAVKKQTDVDSNEEPPQRAKDAAKPSKPAKAKPKADADMDDSSDAPF